MGIVQVVGFGLIAAVLLLVVRQKNAEIGALLSIVAGVVIFLAVVTRIGPVLELFRDLADRAQVNLYYINSILKIIGVAYLAEFGAQICRDAAESALAAKIEMAGKVIILVMAVPIVMAVLEIVLRMLPE